jgi:DNA-binding response OmpR family regulator
MEPLRTITKTRVLVVEDSDPMARFIIRSLGEHFEVVEVCRDGQSAVDAVARLQPTFVLLDIMLPTLDGIGVARRLKQISSDSKIVMITGLEDRSYMMAALDAGAKGYVFKRTINRDLPRALEMISNGHIFSSFDDAD